MSVSSVFRTSTNSPVSPVDTILFCDSLGISLSVESDNGEKALRVVPEKQAPPPHLVDALTKFKPEIIRILSSPSELSDTALELIPMIPPEAGKRLDEILCEYMGNENEKNRSALSSAIVKAYCAYLNQDYPAAIHGYKKWREYVRDQKGAGET